ncbi:MAG: bifunctional nuclease family protein [Caldilineaceae bacterium]|nr:bifunctional nuclease family protein [Caldilineaceae bacterium]
MKPNRHRDEQTADGELIDRCLTGDREAFAALIERHRARLERLLRVLVADGALRDDVWQETLLRAYFHLDQLRDPARFGAWLCTIAANQARTQRYATGKRTLAWEELSDTVANTLRFENNVTQSPEEQMIRNELTSRVRQAIADLPPAEQEAVLLVYLEGMSQKEVAAELGAALSAVKVRVHRGRRRLQVALADVAPQPLSRRQKEETMIAVNVHDVLLEIQQPDANGSKPARPRLADLIAGNRIILLKERDGPRAIAIWVGPYEATSVLLQLQQHKLPRPMTYDLTKALLELGEIKIERAVVQRLHENTFYGNLIVQVGGSASEIDCRPSDAINLALRLNAPLFVASEVIDRVGFGPEVNGEYALAAATEAQIGALDDPAEKEKTAARAQGKIWLSAHAVKTEQLLQEREQLLQEFVASLTTERDRWLADERFPRLLGI